MTNLRIKSMEQLIAWNDAPQLPRPLFRDEKPILLEWFLPYFFIDLIDKKDWANAKIAYHEFIRFTQKCETMQLLPAKEAVDANLGYYSGYRLAWDAGLTDFYKELQS